MEFGPFSFCRSLMYSGRLKNTGFFVVLTTTLVCVINVINYELCLLICILGNNESSEKNCIKEKMLVRR